MRAIMLMYDTLRRDLLPCYGHSEANLPNFERLATRVQTFDNCYAGSLPCMPARRELQTGRLNFLHRSWGPMEPFDFSMPEHLKNSGVYTYLATDHFHYLQDGGATYHNRFSAWECFRGQENDCWDGRIDRSGTPSAHLIGIDRLSPAGRESRIRSGAQNDANRSRVTGEDTFPQSLTVDAGLNFIRQNQDEDRWFLQLELFDPHEPFTSPDSCLADFFNPDHPYAPDWPPYSKVTETQQEISAMRKKYLSLLEFCDRSLGRVLDVMDELNLWEDTMLIVNTDHGFMLGEHEWWGKNICPDYQELVHLPLFIHDPRFPEADGRRCNALVQNLDLVPTLLSFFGVPCPQEVQGKDLAKTVRDGTPAREYALFGYFGSAINVTDGHHVLMQPVVDPSIEVSEYTLMPTHMDRLFTPIEFTGMSLAGPFPFTRGCQVLKLPTWAYNANKLDRPLLFDVVDDPHEEHPLNDPELEARMRRAMADLMRENDAPPELYARMGLQEV